MGDRNHGAGEILQELLQPIHALGIQMVGGLVEQQHVGLGQQQAAQRDAAFFTAGQILDDRFPRWQAQRIGGDFELHLDVLAIGGADDGFKLGLLGGERIEIGIGLGIGGIDLIEPRLGLQHAANTLFHRLAHCLRRVHLWLLRQITDVKVGHGNRFALDLFIETGHDLENGRFTGTVQPQHADLGAGEKRQGNIFENLAFGRNNLAHAVHGVYVLCHWNAIGCCGKRRSLQEQGRVLHDGMAKALFPSVTTEREWPGARMDTGLQAIAMHLGPPRNLTPVTQSMQIHNHSIHCQQPS